MENAETEAVMNLLYSAQYFRQLYLPAPALFYPVPDDASRSITA